MYLQPSSVMLVEWKFHWKMNVIIWLFELRNRQWELIDYVVPKKDQMDVIKRFKFEIEDDEKEEFLSKFNFFHKKHSPHLSTD